MAIDKKLIHFNKDENFQNELKAGNILDKSFVLVKDAEKIHMKGEDYLFVPKNGADGQLLTQKNGKPSWEDAPTSLPDGGKSGQGLTKTSDGYGWRDEEITEEGAITIGDNTLTPVLVDGEPEENAALVSDGEGGVKWLIITGLPSDGKVGQVIMMTEFGPKWVDVSEIIPKD